MGNQAVLLTPFGFAASARCEVASLRAHDAAIARGECAHAGKTMSLLKALPRSASAGDAPYLAVEAECKRRSDQGIHWQKSVADGQLIVHGVKELGDHLAEATLCDLIHLDLLRVGG